MYSLMALLALLASAVYVHAFAFADAATWRCSPSARRDALHAQLGDLPRRSARRRPRPRGARPRRARLLKDAALGFGGAGLLYLPVGPDAAAPGPAHRRPVGQQAALGAPIQISKSCSAAARRRSRSCSSAAPGSRDAAAARGQGAPALIAGAAIRSGTIVLAWLVSQISPAWATRYLGVFVGPMLLLMRSGSRALARSGSPRSRSFRLLGHPALGRTREQGERRRARARPRSARTSARGDVVLSSSPSRDPCSPSTWRGSAALQSAYASPLGPVENDRRWTGATAASSWRARPAEKTLEPLLANLPDGGQGPHRAPGHAARGRLERPVDASWCGAARPSGARPSRTTRSSE